MLSLGSALGIFDGELACFLRGLNFDAQFLSFYFY